MRAFHAYSRDRIDYGRALRIDQHTGNKSVRTGAVLARPTGGSFTMLVELAFNGTGSWVVTSGYSFGGFVIGSDYFDWRFVVAAGGVTATMLVFTNIAGAGTTVPDTTYNFPLVVGQRNRFVLSYDATAGVVRAWHNGAKVMQGNLLNASVPIGTGGVLTWGLRPTPTSQPLAADLAEALYLDYLVGEGGVFDDWNGGRGSTYFTNRRGFTTNCGWWKFEDNLLDSSGNGWNLTAFTAGSATTARVVTVATNAAPIDLTTSTAHGYVVGQTVTVSGATGNTAANGTWVIASVPTTTRMTLTGSSGNGTYTASSATLTWVSYVDFPIPS